jgi:hypothetical protein
MNRRQGLVALGAALLASTALAADSQASSIGLRFASKRPRTTSAMTLHIHYTKAGDPKAKPSPIRRIQIDAPAGTVFHTSTVPACTASDAQVMLLGPDACPSASRIGGGTITVVTGFGAPFDPFASPTPVFNDGNGWLEISQTPSTPAVTIAVTRLAVTGSRIRGDIAASPGGPPDYQSAVSTVDLSFPVSTGYITTPPTCPAAGRWITTGTFTFADGTTEIVRGGTPCARSSSSPPAAIRVELTPSRVRAGRRVKIDVKLTSSRRACIAGATVLVGARRPFRTDGSGRVTVTGTFRRHGRRTVVASKPGCRAGTASLTVLRRDSEGEDDPE